MRLIQETGKVCVLDIDMQGVVQIKNVPSVKPVGVFIKPPSIGELEKRLRRRASESEDSLRARLNAAQQEINYGQSNDFLLTWPPTLLPRFVYANPFDGYAFFLLLLLQEKLQETLIVS